MSKRLFAMLALTLCVSAFLFPTAAYAATDKTPPTVRAWINGDLLHVEAFDDVGVESAYINNARVNYRVDGSFDLLMRDYAGTGEYVAVYAMDFEGNKSNVVTLKNPYYVPSTSTPTPAPATPTPALTQTPPPATPKPTPKSIASTTPTTAPTQTPAPTPEPTPEATASVVPTEQKPFTPGGTGTVVDNVVEQNAGTSGASKEFFTITTADDNSYARAALQLNVLSTNFMVLVPDCDNLYICSLTVSIGKNLTPLPPDKQNAHRKGHPRDDSI